MSTCAMPILVNDQFIGCVTVDIQLDAITTLIDNIKVGDAGRGMPLPQRVSISAVQRVTRFRIALRSQRTRMRRHWQRQQKSILAGDSGETSYKGSDGQINLYYSRVDATGWILIITMPNAELTQPIMQIFGKTVWYLYCCPDRGSPGYYFQC